MRFKALVVFVLVILFSAAGYSAVAAGTAYWSARGLVHRVVSDSAAKRRAAANAGIALQSGDAIRHAILAGAREHHLPLRAESVAVSESRASVVVKVGWAQPMLPYGPASEWIIPMAFEWTFDVR